MIPHLREQFNASFSNSKYEKLLADIEQSYPGALDFRIAETPVFLGKELAAAMVSACEHIVDVIQSESFTKITERSIPDELRITGTEGIPDFIAFDFGICRNEEGKIVPQLIEMQGFPSLFAYQVMLGDLMRDYASVPENFSSYLSGYNRESYLQELKEIILGGHDPEEVVLMEIFPEKQKTRIDFKCTEKMLGISTVCYTKINADGNKLYYEREGKRRQIRRIFNRMIMDDLQQQPAGTTGFDLSHDYEVEWVPHPNWFYRISKYTLPYLHHECIPSTYFLNEVKQPLPLEEYVLKPLFSFAGMGVKIDVTAEDIDNITDPGNWILQKKVQYAPVISTPDEPAMAEVRIFYQWKSGAARPKPAHNLVRLSKGKMVGTRYNRDKTWVGGTIGFFET